MIKGDLTKLCHDIEYNYDSLDDSNDISEDMHYHSDKKVFNAYGVIVVNNNDNIINDIEESWIYNILDFCFY